MKYLPLSIFAFLIIVVASCTKEEPNSEPNSSLIGLWNLENYSGGIIGISCDYSPGSVTWEFKEQNILEITVNSASTSEMCQGSNIELGSKTFSYDLIENNGRFYFVMEGNEWGEVFVNENTFFINGNNTTQGDGADGFGYAFNK